MSTKEANIAQEGKGVQMSSWDLVVSCLHHKGSKYSDLSPEQQQTVRRAADGFGAVYGFDNESLDMLWDWSHVRDSTNEAIEKMAKLLRAWGF